MENLDPNSLLRKAQALGNDIKEIESINVAQAYDQARLRIKTTRRKAFYNLCMRYAAFLALPLFLTTLLFGYLHFRVPQGKETFAEITAAPGSVIRYELPDNSVVWLNSGSSLRYSTAFNKKKRSVALKGEAYFEVEADEKHPFYVDTKDGLTAYVYGTQFNVAAYEDESSVEVVLAKGKLNVITAHQQPVVLKPGDQILFNTQTQLLTQSAVDIYEKVAWKDGKIIFRNATLEDIFKRLERHFNVEIEFNNRNNKEYKYRATFRNETLTQILDYLSKSASLKWKINDAEQQKDDTFTKKRITINLD